MATLNVTITEELTLNGSDRGSINTLSVASVTQVYHRIVTCPSSVDTTVATFQTATSTSDNAIDLEDAKSEVENILLPAAAALAGGEEDE